MLNQPGLALDLPVDLLDNNHPAGKALVDLATFVKDVPDASVAVIIDHFSHGPHGRTLAEAQASAMHMQIEDEDQKIEFRDALQHLNARRRADLGAGGGLCPGGHLRQPATVSRLAPAGS